MIQNPDHRHDREHGRDVDHRDRIIDSTVGAECGDYDYRDHETPVRASVYGDNSSNEADAGTLRDGINDDQRRAVGRLPAGQ